MLDPAQTLLTILAGSIIIFVVTILAVVGAVIGYGLWKAWEYINKWS